MAEVIETQNGMTTMCDHQTIPSNSKTNAALTLGIIGTALAGLSALGSGKSLLGSVNPYNNMPGCTPIEEQKRFYEGYIDTMNKIHADFDEAKQRDIDNSFQLYKYTRDSNDNLLAAINASAANASAQKDALAQKLLELESKVDIMAAIRPYQDALINERIDKTGMIADFNLHKRTCRMIQGELILPSTSTVEGYESYNYWK